MELLLKIPELSTRLNLPKLTPILPLIISIHLYLSSPSKNLNFLLIPILFYYSIISPIIYTTGNSGGDFGLGSQGIYTFFNIIDKLLLSNLEKDFLRNEDKIVPTAWTIERFKWSLKLYATMRASGWKWEVKNTPKIIHSSTNTSKSSSTTTSTNSTTSRFQFCIRRFLSAITLYLFMDLLSNSYMKSRPYFRRQISFKEVPILERYFNMLCGGLAGWTALSLLYELVVIISVSSTFWSIEECPPLFGRISDSYLIAGFWSKTWLVFSLPIFVSLNTLLIRRASFLKRHQGLRRTFSRPGTVLSNILRLSPTSLSRKLIIVTTTFSLSALQHSFAAYTMDRKGIGSGIFFLLQPIGIFLEGLICYLGRRIGLKRNKGFMIFGYFWTMSWLLISSPWFIDELVQVSYFLPPLVFAIPLS